ncbi:hypothetical protein PF005_g4586 [Phytophthora fragariae]|uniref:Uncharacterized protein n=1 Tax=Phytophthora fragariae TaxID=53985 RepID=A0A6A3ULX6_9STRA|nr:hypothetical protein PF003_g1145 [Phytophthora fragariae]KAE8945192.1 hypothetical protein PF009_g5151 [Phytophthora fragariae]KAE9023591.1 hypothetical protein PF011_g3914 [Phytophthora fragariae]KAE9126597.1 hypothetical protein PF007_g5924 [Phytophthora fragariae]KAE9127087.1 hypothetical protein PF010_g5051 [Phytophthora fragariae]
MKPSIVAIAFALVDFVSFVLAVHQPAAMTTPMPADERMQLAKAIKEMVSSNPGAVDPAFAAMSTEALFNMLTGLISNPEVLTNAAGLIASVKSGEAAGLASHTTELLCAVNPPSVSDLTHAAAPAP